MKKLFKNFASFYSVALFITFFSTFFSTFWGVLFFGPFPARAFAAQSPVPTVVLLTSLASPKIWFKSAAWDLNAQLETDFREAFAHSGYQVIVRHHATGYDLAQALRSSQNVGVFWVSHAAADSPQDSSPLGKDNVVLDQDGVNVMDAFQLIHPNLRWLSVVGCETQSILDGFKQAQMYRNNPLLIVQDYSRPVDAEAALADSLNASVPVLGADPRSRTADQLKAAQSEVSGESSDESSNDDPLLWEASQDSVGPFPVIYGSPGLLSGPAGNSPCSASEPGIMMTIQRSIAPGAADQALSEVFVYLGSHLLSVLPKPTPGQIQSVSVPLSQNLIAEEMKAGGGSLSMIVSTGASAIPRLKPVLGQFTFQSTLGTWDLFADSSGQAIGVTSHMYLHHGEVAPVSTGPVPILGCTSP